MGSLSYSGKERRSSSPVEVVAFKNGAKTGLWALFITIIIQVVTLTAFIVTTRNRVTHIEEMLMQHIQRTESNVARVPVVEQKVDDLGAALERHDRGNE